MSALTPPPLLIRPISPLPGGEIIEPLNLDGSKPIVLIGRTSATDWTVPDMGVSRRHAAIEAVGGDWLISDTGSRHGTWVNGQRLAEDDKLPLRIGDQIRLGMWICRCDSPHAATSRLTSIDHAPATRDNIRRVRQDSLAGVAQKRLDALIEASHALEQARSRSAVAETLARCAAAGSGCATVLVIRPAGPNQYEELATTAGQAGVALSSTLLEAATEGELVQLVAGAGQFSGAQSVIDLGINSAICAPIMVAGSADCLLYLDTRASQRALADDITTFCSALAQLGSSAIERILTTELTARREQLERDLDAARHAQQLLMPPRAAERPCLRYFFESLPGRYVAGDLFDVVELPDDRTAFFLGDVSGKGAAASLLMAAAQTHLRANLARGVPLVDAIDELNRFVHAHTETKTFITMIAGVFYPAALRVELVDAGHGLCCLRPANRPPERLDISGGLPIGVATDHPYESTELTVDAGDRLVLFSDGLVEQTDAEGSQFGLEKTLQSLAPSRQPETDVRILLDAVQAHADGPLADDLTIVSIGFAGNQ